MTPTATLAPSSPYDVLARVYPLLCEAGTYSAWIRRLGRLAVRHGLGGRRVLDVACGTGQSFLPLLRAGYEITACDQSEAMLEEAARASGERADLHRLDMRELPALGAFDLVTCIDDAANHLLDEHDLIAALQGMSRNLAPGGLVLLDLNTLDTLRTAFAQDWELAGPEGEVCWTGCGDPGLCSGGVTRALIDVAVPAADGGVERSTVEIRERHHPLADLTDVLDAAGLELVALVGQEAGGRLLDEVATEHHHKAVVLAGRKAPTDGRCEMQIIRP